jgi:hypothetical protein
LSTSSGSRERTTYSRRWVAANVALALCLASIACSDAPPSRPLETGQWIWSVEDSSRFADASRTFPSLVPTVWIGTIAATRDGRVESRLALSPRIAGRPNAAVVIRFDDAFTNVWTGRADSAIAADLNAALDRILSAASSAGVHITEVQIDYDCPDRLLTRWSNVVGWLARDALAGRVVWLTSLVTHLRQRAYGDLFRAHVAGHILQVFDTGDRMSLSYARQIERLAERHRMPFRLGVGAFERRLANGRTTDHRAWFTAERVMRQSRWYRGVWVFPGGMAWAGLLDARP